MPSIKFSHVVSFSSEDLPAFGADNLLRPEGARKWRCASAGEKQVSAVLQLERASVISQIDIGNDGSAFVEVQVGRTDTTSNEEDFKTLLAAASFMSPLESRNEDNPNRVRMFGQEKMNAEVCLKKWDRVRLVCQQPFNKHVKYGLSFITLSGPSSGSDVAVANGIGVAAVEKKVQEVEKRQTTKLGAFSIREETKEDEEMEDATPVGSLFAARRRLQTAREAGGLGCHSPTGLSAAAELRSQRTLASMALAQVSSSPDGNKRTRQENEPRPFYQLKKKEEQRQKREEISNGKAKKRDSDSSKEKKLPRRDVLPGESPPPRTKNKERVVKKSPSPKAVISAPKKKPFRQLLEGVVFAISGIQNPQRGTLREAALAMGAKYRPDWDSSCSHLICAFTNTPKYNEVQKAKGKIVKKEWIERCKADRKRYPWRRYCLDPKDKEVDESEEEVWEESQETPTSSSLIIPSTSDLRAKAAAAASKRAKEDMDTDDEIEEVMRESKERQYDTDTDDGEQKDSDDAYNADTDVDSEEESGSAKKRIQADRTECPADLKGNKASKRKKTDNLPLPDLPDFLLNRYFYLFGDFSDSERKSLERKIISAGGYVSPYMSKRVTFVITNSDWCEDFEDAEGEDGGGRLQIARPEFVSDCYSQGKLVDVETYLVKPDKR